MLSPYILESPGVVPPLTSRNFRTLHLRLQIQPPHSLALNTFTRNKQQNSLVLFCKINSTSGEMDIRFLGFDTPIFNTLHHILDGEDSNGNKSAGEPTRAYVRDARAMAGTPADVIDYANSYVFVVDMPGLKSEDIKVQLEDSNVLLISGERKREEEKEGGKYVRMERRMGKFLRKFTLPENANTEKIAAVCKDGVLTVTVEKLPPPEPKKPKTIEVKIA